jgi:CHAT domain-containing protein
MKNKRHHSRNVICLILFVTGVCLTVNGQTPNEPQTLQPNQTIEREMSGAETHQYQIDLKADEFLQVHVEQKGVDVTLRLLDANGDALVTMDSPNGKEGFETLTFVAARAGGFILEVINSDAKVEKGKYIIKREVAREATVNDKRRVTIEKLFVEGMAARNTGGQAEIAIKKLTEALAGWEELKDEYLKDLTAQQIKQMEIVVIFRELYDDSAKARTTLNEAKELTTKSRADGLLARDKAKEALSGFRALTSKLTDKTFVEKINSLKNEGYTNALKELQLLTKVFEADSLSAIAETHYNLGEWQQRVDGLKQVISINQELIANEYFRNSSRLYGNYFLLKVNQANTFVAIGQMLYVLGQPDKAIEFYNQALQSYRSLYQEAQNPDFKLDRALFSFKIAEAQVLIEIGNAYSRNSNNRKKGIDSYSKGVEIYKGFGDRKEEAATGLYLIADKYAQDLNYEAALKTIDEALKYFVELDHKQGQSETLGLKGILYVWLNDKTKANEIFNQIIGILQSTDYNENVRKRRFSFVSSGALQEKVDDAIERERLDSIAIAYKSLENFQKSNEYFEKSLLIARANKDLRVIRTTLGLIAFNYASLKQWNKATDYYQQALAISRGGEVKEELADDLRDVGWTLLEAGKYKEALQYQNEALITYQSVGVGENKAFTLNFSGLLNELSQTYYALGNKRLAVFYGKRAVNAMQGERQRLQNLDPVSQKGFLEKKEKHYRRLADWLIAEGRLPEAEQVLAMLKEDEYFRFIRRDPTETDKLSQRADLSSDEKDALKRYNQISSRLAAIGLEYSQLEEKRKNLAEGVLLPPDEQKRFDEITKQIEDAGNVFQVFLRQLAEEFAKTPKAIKVKDESQQNGGLRLDLKRWRSEFGDEGVVALYTVVGEDRYRVILTSPDVQTDGKYEIKAEKLREKIAAFRQAVQDPRLDPRPLGKELYDILIKPIEKQLEGAKAKTLLWSLDDILRYVPMAALWDGKQYFGQKYQNVIITLASRTRLNEKPDSNWRVLGLGVSEAKQINLTEPDGSNRSMSFNALPAVREELKAIIRDETSQETETGVLPGRRLLNSTFTEASLKQSLGKRYKVIHIASHFSFRPGDLTDSFLLLGDGQVLTLNKIKNNPQLAFIGVELLTLSACKTAVGDANANGVEIESFGVIAQETGAKAILATLWSVADESTSLLMSEFYRLRKETPQLTKAEALQRAQQEMIAGKLKPSQTKGDRRDTSEAVSETATDYTHPYYWSPFILIGNWR